MRDRKQLPIFEQRIPWVEQPAEHVELKIADVIIARQVDCVLQRVRFIAHTKFVHFVQLVAELLPRHNVPFRTESIHPKFLRLTLGNAKAGANEFAIGEFRFQFR